MSRRYFLVALLGMFLAAAGLWCDGGRTEAGVSDMLNKLNRSRQLPALRVSDSIYWLAYSRDMVNSGALTEHFTHMDNAPYGRENIGWAALNMWHVAIIGKIWALATGAPFQDALLISSRWANPILYFAALAAILIVGWRCGAFRAAAVAVLIMGTAPRVYDDFAFATPGHHGWHDLTTLGTILCLVAAIRNPARRRWFVLAGIAAAMAIWVGATEQAVTITATFAGALAGMLLAAMEYRAAKRAGRGEEAAPHFAILPAPECWRLFGITACVFSLAFYVFEFHGHLFRMRLEVNHPIFSLAFLAGGEFLCRTQRLLFSGKGTRSAADVPVLILSALVLGGIAAMCVAGPASWHIMHDPFMQRFHKELAEFKPITDVMGSSTVFFVGTPLLLVLCGAVLALRGRLSANDRMALLSAVLPCAASLAASFLQFRWAGLAGASAAAIGAVLYLPRKPAPYGRDVSDGSNVTPAPDILENRTLSLLGIVIPALLVAVMFSMGIGDISPLIEGVTQERIASVEIGDALSKDAQSIHRPPVVIFSGQDDRQAWVGYVYGIPCVGSLYWDNPDGLHDEVTFLAGYDENEARRIAKERGITHIITTPDSGAVIAYHYILHGVRNAPGIRQTLAYRLAAPVPNPPDWIQLLPINTPAMRARGIRIYRVTP